MCFFDVLLMQQSVSHNSARALILIINILMLSPDNNPYKATYGGSQSLSATYIQTHHSFRLNTSLLNLGQQILPWFSHLHTKNKNKPSSTPCFFFYVWTVFGPVPESEDLLALVVAHFLLSRVNPPPTHQPTHRLTQPHPIMPVKGNKAGISL